MSSRLGIVLVEDHELLLDALLSALADEADLQVLGSARSVDEFCRLVPAIHPDVVVTDLELADGSGTDVALHTGRTTDAQVLFISGRGDDRGVSAALETGAAGFVSKSAPLDQLIDAIRKVADGSAVFPAARLRRVLNPNLTEPGVTLSAREMEVLQALARGKTASEIAEEQVNSVHTIRNHIRSVLSKLHARSQLEAVVIAVRSGLVEIS